ncbi:hypothetical protein RF11_11848 [Thelohanellus kitauei]|uniref:Uncharacterized protein n=1 Tax=Thelohanellus kitauei TaxID=669202 RepID=A0A0C2JBH8_THEKT|nr:hypothetical protein RF11_11848 [Thelohanellus kitauei]
MRATQLKDNQTETDNKPIFIGYIRSPGPLCYEIFLKKKTEGVYYVIKDQKASKPRNRIVLQIGNRLRFLEKILDFMKFAEENKKWSISDKIPTDFDRESYSEMKTEYGRLYRFKTFVEESVPYLRICYIYEGRHHSMVFHVHGIEWLIINIRRFSECYPNRIDGEDNYDDCDICGGLGRCLFGKPDSYKNKPIIIPSYMDFGQNNG